MSPQGRVLFVDDEKNILKSLHRAFIQSDFESVFANNGREALDILANEEIDILVTDIRMPEIDGLQLLKLVKDRYPGIHRIVLSGFVEEKTVMAALNSGLATTHFGKPWDDRVLEERLLHLLETRRSLGDSKLLTLLGTIDNFPTFSTLYLELVDALERERNIADIAEIVQKDVAASAKILKVANSAFFGSYKVKTLPQAIIKIGTFAVKNIFLSMSVVNNMRWDPVQVKHLDEIFEHSALVNGYLRRVYRERFDADLPLECSSVGIIHDIGKIIQLQYFFDTYQRILSYRQNHPGLDYYDSEIALGFDQQTHAEIGAYFMDNWNLPQLFVQVALCHHRPETAGEDMREFLEVFHHTDRLVSWASSTIAGMPDDEMVAKVGIPREKMELLVLDIRRDWRQHDTF
jgi:HD-like signal output (HDOD) protein/ActR/RegA family two-component response regulator